MDNLHTKEVVTCEEMKQLERMADEAGLSYYEMMENAGTKAAQYILDAMCEATMAEKDGVFKRHSQIRQFWF